jgi:hypothetical protein
MSLRRWFFNVLPSGTTLNTSNTVSADSATATSASAGTGGTIQSSDVHVHNGDTSCRFVGGGTGAGSSQLVRLPFVTGETSRAAALSAYHWGTALTARDIINVRHASGQLFRIGVSGTGAVQVKDSTGGTLGSTATGAWAIDRWNRIEAFWDNAGGTAAGSITLEVYNGDSLTPTGSVSLSGVNLGAAVATHVDVGSPNSGSATDAHYFDSVQMDNGATAFIGPYVVVNVVPVVTPGPTQNVAGAATVGLSFTATDSDGTIASRATTFDFPTSGAPSITGGTGDTPSFTAGSAPQYYLVKHEATDDDGGVGSATTEVRVPTTGAGTSNPIAMASTAKVGTWTNVGGVATEGGAVADASDSTYLESDTISGVSQEITLRLLPRAALASGSITVRLATDTGTTTATIRLRRGTTVIQTWSQAITSTPTDYELTLDGAAITAANLDPGDLRISVAVAS